MSTTEVVGSPRLGTQLSTQQDTSTCLVTIGRDAGQRPTGIRVYPNRVGDAKVYYPRAGTLPPTLPREILWVVNYLRPNERVIIEAKSRQPRVFGDQVFVIAYPCNAVSSGPVIPPEGGGTVTWAYNIKLEGGTIPVPVLDPVIIIEEDP